MIYRMIVQINQGMLSVGGLHVKNGRKLYGNFSINCYT